MTTTGSHSSHRDAEIARNSGRQWKQIEEGLARMNRRFFSQKGKSLRRLGLRSPARFEGEFDRRV
jgi:hypothetical protein